MNSNLANIPTTNVFMKNNIAMIRNFRPNKHNTLIKPTQSFVCQYYAGSKFIKLLQINTQCNQISGEEPQMNRATAFPITISGDGSDKSAFRH